MRKMLKLRLKIGLKRQFSTGTAYSPLGTLYLLAKRKPAGKLAKLAGGVVFEVYFSAFSFDPPQAPADFGDTYLANPILLSFKILFPFSNTYRFFLYPQIFRQIVYARADRKK